MILRATSARQPATPDSRGEAHLGSTTGTRWAPLRAWDTRTWRLLLMVGVVALLIRVAFVLALGNRLYLGDEYHYHNLAIHLADGRGFVGDYGNGTIAPTALKMPLLPAIMSVLYIVAGPSPLLVRLANSLLSVALVPMAYLIALSLGYDRRVGVFAAIGTAAYPYYIFAAGAIYPVVIATVLIAAATLALLAGSRREGVGLEVLGGLLLGVALLAFSHVALAVPFVAVWVWINKRSDVRRRVAAACLVALGVCVVIVPWMIRNQVAVGKFGLSTAFEISFYLGNAPGATWTSGSHIMELGSAEVFRKARQLGEAEAAQLYWDAGVREIRRAPGRFIWLAFGKALNFWRPFPNLSSRPISLLEKLVGCLTYGPVMVLGFVWFVVDKQHRASNAVLFCYPLATMAPIAISCSQDRYRMPFDLYLIVLASAAVVTWWSARCARSTRMAKETSIGG